MTPWVFPVVLGVALVGPDTDSTMAASSAARTSTRRTGATNSAIGEMTNAGLGALKRRFMARRLRSIGGEAGIRAVSPTRPFPMRTTIGAQEWKVNGAQSTVQ